MIAHALPYVSPGVPKSRVGQDTLLPVEGRRMGIKHGFDRVRFLAPVAAGPQVRGHFRLTDVEMLSALEAMLRCQGSVEIEHVEKPALVADWIEQADVS